MHSVGQYERLSQLYKVLIQEKLEHQRKIQERNQQKHQKRIELIKETQQLALPSLEVSSPVSIEATTVKKNKG